MGITDFSVQLLNRVFEKYPNIKTVAELGDQNLYTAGENYGKYANIFYEDKGLKYVCIDANGGNNSLNWDLSKVQPVSQQYDLITDFGVSEHIEINGSFDWDGIYNCWLNKHNLLKVGGIMINENPKDGHWPLHGYNYYTQDFYKELAAITDYEITEIGEVGAMGNWQDGMNIYCILQKHSELFPTLEQFKILPLKSREQQIPENTLTCGIEHKIGNETYNITKTELDGKTCNCGKFIYRAEMCGCVEKKLELKAYENN